MTTAAAGNRGSRTRFKVALVLAVVLVGLMVPRSTPVPASARTGRATS